MVIYPNTNLGFVVMIVVIFGAPLEFLSFSFPYLSRIPYQYNNHKSLGQSSFVEVVAPLKYSRLKAPSFLEELIFSELAALLSPY